MGPENSKVKCTCGALCMLKINVGDTHGAQGLLNKRQLGDADRGAPRSWAAMVWGLHQQTVSLS